MGSIGTTAIRAREPRLEVALLGPPTLTWGGQQLEIPRRQARALLYRLAASLQPLPRDHLSFLLWSDFTQAEARRNLSVVSSQLRRALPAPDLLVTLNDTLGLHHATITVDAIRFTSFSHAAPGTGLLEGLVAATQLYRGPFLDGFTLPGAPEFEAWADQERQQWERRYLDALVLLIVRHAEAGDYASAVAAARQALAVDPLAEETHRWLMALYAAQGDRSAALRQFEQCVVALERELGVNPLPETRAVSDAIRAGEVPLQIIPGLAPRSRTAGVFTATLAAAEAEPPPVSRALPAPTTALIGRQSELAALSELLSDSQVRLLSLTGAGGSGKTRLALEAARASAAQFADGAVFVALAALRDPALVIEVIAQACGFGQRGLTALAEQLRAKQLLIVLDNCEHLLAAATDVAALLAAAPGLRVLVTSRTPLHILGEHTFAVAPLPLPDLAQLPPLDALTHIPAVALLLARTRAQLPHFQLTAENAADLAAICVRLDGLPLALELAATRLALLAPRDLLRRLSHRLRLLTTGAHDLPARQQTLRATVEWSYQLLRFDEQRWLERLSVFAGGWTLEAAEALDASVRGAVEPQASVQTATQQPLDLLDTLVRHSLVYVERQADDGVRFGMLETIREYAAERLHEHGEAVAVGKAHADLFVEFIERLERTGVAANTERWVTTIARDHDNLRLALRYYLDHNHGEQALRLGSALHRFWYWRDYERESQRWLEEIAARTTHIHTLERAQLIGRVGVMAAARGELPKAIALYEQALELCALFPVVRLHVTLRNALGTLLCRRGEYPQAIMLLEAALALAQQRGDRDTIQLVLGTLAGVEAWTRQYLGLLALLTGDDAAARQQFRQSLTVAIRLEYRNIVPTTLEGLAAVTAAAAPAAAARLLGAAEALRERTQNQRPPLEQPFFERTLNVVRAQLASKVLRAAWYAGRSLALPELLAEVEAAIEGVPTGLSIGGVFHGEP
jgi:predicted ATPase/DNA-binding SARP family transcriptional activator